VFGARQLCPCTVQKTLLLPLFIDPRYLLKHCDLFLTTKDKSTYILIPEKIVNLEDLYFDR
jgi:hypothetical protein